MYSEVVAHFSCDKATKSSFSSSVMRALAFGPAFFFLSEVIVQSSIIGLYWLFISIEAIATWGMLLA
jgi:hypothetical protein